MGDRQQFELVLGELDHAFERVYQGDTWYNGPPSYGMIVRASCLPEELMEDARIRVPDRKPYPGIGEDPYVGLRGTTKPEVAHFAGWEHLERRLREADVSNRSRDSIFREMPLRVTIEPYRFGEIKYPRFGCMPRGFTRQTWIMPVVKVELLL